MFSLDEVVPWAGRSTNTRRAHIVSGGPIYQWPAEDIRARITITSGRILEETRRNAHQFVWNTIPSIEELGRLRTAAMDDFLRDDASRSSQGRYVAAELPRLPFVNAAFAVALCSHLLFLYSAQLDEEADAKALKEMCRVAGEVRVFPLVSLAASPVRTWSQTPVRCATPGTRSHSNWCLTSCNGAETG